MEEKDLKDLAKEYEYATTKFGKIEMVKNVNIAKTLSENRMDEHISILEESIINEMNDEQNVEIFTRVKDKFKELFKELK